MKESDVKKLVIKNGMTAIYNSPKGPKRVVIANVKTDHRNRIIFNLKDIFSGKIIRSQTGDLLLLAEIVIKNNIVVIDNPIFLGEREKAESTAH